MTEMGMDRNGEETKRGNEQRQLLKWMRAYVVYDAKKQLSITICNP